MIKEAMKEKDNFLAVLSHELRTPLTPALLLCQELESDCNNQRFKMERVKEDISMILRSLALEVRLIDDLLDLTRITKGKVQINMTNVDLRVSSCDHLECGCDCTFRNCWNIHTN